MSEYDADSGHESQGLSQADESYNGDHDASQSLEAAGSHHQIEFDEHLVHVHHVEYDDAQGNHFEETSYEVVDVHVVESDDSFSEHADTGAAQSYGDVSFIHDELEQLLHNSTFEHGLDQQLAPGGSDADGLSGISEASN